MNLLKLKTVFPADHIEWRVAQCGKKQDGSIWAKCVAYIENRAIMDRLDEVCGPENWVVRFRPIGGQGSVSPGIVATIGIKIAGEWIEKEDGAEQTDTESFKGGLSSAMKRTAVQWGIGRYLYDLKEEWAETSLEKLDGWRYGKTKEGVYFYWSPPKLPAWALPKQPEGAPEKTVAATPVVSKSAVTPAVKPKAVVRTTPTVEDDVPFDFDQSGPLGPNPPPHGDMDQILAKMRTPGAMPTRD